MVVAPHALAAQSGLAVLREGGNAIEAAVATAATLAVVYPHMTGIGGDAFWMLRTPGSEPVAIDACGRTPTDLTTAFYRDRGLDAIPVRGPLAANSVAGAVSAWGRVLDHSREAWGGRLPLTRILADAIEYAEQGYPLTAAQAATTTARLDELAGLPGFGEVFLQDGRPREGGTVERQPVLGATLRRIAEAGCDDFYRGELAEAMAAELQRLGSPVTQADLDVHRALSMPPLSVRFGQGRVYNTAPPTQGLASLMMLALFERAGGCEMQPDSTQYLHTVVEATKLAFQVRDRHVRDPQDMTVTPQDLLADAALDELAARIDPKRAMPWGGAGDIGDTTWFGVVDGEGRAVSAIQSLYHEYGSGVVLEDTGVVWQNRGISFTLEPGSPRELKPGRKPFHTLNPAMAELDDGRLLVYGSMGGDGQPQTQAAVFTRCACFGVGPQEAITRPRWLLGRTWGENSNTLKLESRFDPAVVQGLRHLGHEVEVVGDYDEMMGHAGAIVRNTAGVLEGGADPRSDGVVAAF
jgi:gamma-glutamyltranspeptidase